MSRTERLLPFIRRDTESPRIYPWYDQAGVLLPCVTSTGEATTTLQELTPETVRVSRGVRADIALTDLHDGIWPVWLCRGHDDHKPAPGILFLWTVTGRFPWEASRAGVVCLEGDEEGVRDAQKEAARNPTLFRARHESRHFDWEGFGRTPEEAKEALLATWNRNARDTYATVNHFEAANGEICIDALHAGFGYCDRELS